MSWASARRDQCFALELITPAADITIPRRRAHELAERDREWERKATDLQQRESAVSRREAHLGRLQDQMAAASPGGCPAHATNLTCVNLSDRAY